MLRGFQGQVIKGKMDSPGNLFLLGCLPWEPSHHIVRNPSAHEETHASVLAGCQLRSQLTVSINCRIGERMSLQTIPASGLRATSADAAWSRGTYPPRPCPNGGFMSTVMLCLLFEPLRFWVLCYIVIITRTEAVLEGYDLRLWDQTSWFQCDLCHLFPV